MSQTRPNIPGISFDPTDECKATITSVESRDGDGKTTLALLAAKPLFILNFDRGLHRAINNPKVIPPDWISQDLIGHKTFLYTVPQGVRNFGKWTKETYDAFTYAKESIKKEVVDPLFEILQPALDSGYFRTVVIDSCTELFSIFKLAHFGREEKIPQQKYNELNSDFEGVVAKIKEHPIHLILCHQLKPEYADVKVKNEKGEDDIKSMKTGGYVTDGYGKLTKMCDQIIRVESDLPDQPGQFQVRVIKAKENKALTGAVLPSTEWRDWLDLAMALRPNADPTSWAV